MESGGKTDGDGRARQLKTDDSTAASPEILIGAHYFSGWYTCKARANCTGHISGYTPTGTENWFDTCENTSDLELQHIQPDIQGLTCQTA